jgi:predicted TIM-barrel fold metal-dependent hydrolase
MDCIDTHAHIAPDTRYDEIISSMDAAQVSRIGIMPRGGAEESDVMEFYSRYSDRVIPFYGGSDIQTIFMEGGKKRETPGMKYFHGYREEWWNERLDEFLGCLEHELTAAPYKGIGELRIRHYGNGPAMPEKEHDYDFPADSTFMFRLIDLSARLKLPVAVHMECEAKGEYICFLHRQAEKDTLPMLERLLEHNRSAVIIWSHLGRAAPEVLDGMLERHPNLHTDISDVLPRGRHGRGISSAALSVFAEYPFKNSILDEGGQLRDEWRRLFEKHSNRIMMGTDAMSAKGYGKMYRSLTDQIRDVLSSLSEQASKLIASGNARRVFAL